MKNIILISILILGFVNAYSQYSDADIKLSFSELVEKYENVGVSSAYSLDGETIWKSSIGYADKEDGKEFTSQTKVRIASIVKLWTAIGIMQLVEKDMIALDSSIENYIEGYPQKGKKPITVRHLLSHTSGLASYKNSKEIKSTKQYDTLKDVVSVFSNRKLKFQPGKDFYYTTYGYVVLGLIIENVSGVSYEDYIKTNILEVAEMQNTAIEKYGIEYDNKSEIYHMNKGKVIKPEPNNLSNRIPAGGYYSTVDDLMKFGNAVVSDKFLSKESMDQMLTISFSIEEGNPYGLGWQLYGPKGQEKLIIGHGGAQYGANSQLFIIPHINSTIVVLSNTSETEDKNIGQFSSKVLNKVLSENKERFQTK